MSDRDSGSEALRQAAREALHELMPEMLRELSAVVPAVPAPPVAAVMRPSTWSGPAVPGEIVGDGAAPTPPDADAPGGEAVRIDSTEDLQRFVRVLAARMESPGDRRAIATGAVRFTLQRSPSPASAAAFAPAAADAPAIHIAKGAVTERTVRDAAARGARLVVARGAVLTPLARDTARSLHVQIEREDGDRC
jgi:hypothetical protein